MDLVRESAKLRLNSQENVLKQIRTSLGMSQREFASILGTTHRTLVRYENGQREPIFSLPQIRSLQLQLWKLGLDFQDLPNDWNVKVKSEPATKRRKTDKVEKKAS